MVVYATNKSYSATVTKTQDPEVERARESAQEALRTFVAPAGGALADYIRKYDVKIDVDTAAKQPAVKYSEPPSRSVTLTLNRIGSDPLMLDETIRLLSQAERSAAGRRTTDLEQETIDNIKRVGTYLLRQPQLSPEERNAYENQLGLSIGGIQSRYHERLVQRPAQIMNAYLVSNESALTPLFASLAKNTSLGIEVDVNAKSTSVVREVMDDGKTVLSLTLPVERVNELTKAIASTVEALVVASRANLRAKAPSDQELTAQTIQVLDQVILGLSSRFPGNSDVVQDVVAAKKGYEAMRSGVSGGTAGLERN